MSTFWRLFKESYIIQGTVTLIVVSTIVYLYIVGRPVPTELVNIAMLILGFYFGGKSQQTLSKGDTRNENSIYQHSD